MASWSSDLMEDDILSSNFQMEDDAFLGATSPGRLQLPQTMNIDRQSRDFVRRAEASYPMVAHSVPPNNRRQYSESLPRLNSVARNISAQGTVATGQFQQTSQVTEAPAKTVKAQGTSIQAHSKLQRLTSGVVQMKNQFNTEINSLATDISSLTSEIRSLTTEISSIQDKLTHVEQQQKTIDRDFRKFDAQLKTLDEWATGVKSDVEKAERDIDSDLRAIGA